MQYIKKHRLPVSRIKEIMKDYGVDKIKRTERESEFNYKTRIRAQKMHMQLLSDVVKYYEINSQCIKHSQGSLKKFFIFMETLLNNESIRIREILKIRSRIHTSTKEPKTEPAGEIINVMQLFKQLKKEV